jgi:hypothetical protein
LVNDISLLLIGNDFMDYYRVMKQSSIQMQDKDVFRNIFIDHWDPFKVKWTPSQGQFSPKLRCASFCILTELFMLPFGQLSLSNTPQ